MEWVIIDLILLFCVLIFAGVGVWALVRKTPMHFWAGSTVKPEQITDIKKYNMANAVMWFCYCIPFVISMFVAPFSMHSATAILLVGALGGTVLLIVAYMIIYSKYKRRP